MSSDQQIGELLKLAGRREMPDTAQMSRAKAAARAEWMRVVEKQRRPFLMWALGSAAIVAVALLAAARFRSGDAPRMVPPVEIATLETVVGDVRVMRSDGSVSTVIQRGARLLTGDRIETPPGARAAFSLQGTAVKLDSGSTVLLKNGELTLEAGALFVDAGAHVRGERIDVSTSLGVVRHLGTQFEVRLNDGELRVSVREGTVALESAGGRWISNEGEALHVVPGRTIERRSIPTDGGEWSWVNDLAPAFVLEGSTLGAFLDWAARHHGLRWRYADPAMRDRVERIVLHGSIEDLSAEEALDAVLRTCGLTYRRDEKRVIVIGPGR